MPLTSIAQVVEHGRGHFFSDVGGIAVSTQTIIDTLDGVGTPITNEALYGSHRTT